MGNYFLDKYGDNNGGGGNFSNAQNSAANTGNYFLDKYGNTGQQSSSANNIDSGSLSSPSNDQGAFMAGLENFNRSFARMAEGAMQGITSGVDAILGTNSRSSVDEMIARNDASAKAAAQNHPIAAMIGGVTGDVARTIPAVMALPATAAASPLGVIGSGAAVNAAMGGLEAAPTVADRLHKAEAGALSGAVGGALAGTVGSVGGMLMNKEGTGFINKFISPQSAAANVLLNEAKMAPGGAEQVLANADNAAAKGFQLSPAQAMNTASMTAKEGTLPLDSYAAKQAINSQNLTQQANAVGQLNQTIDNIVPQGDMKTAMATRDQLYNQLKGIPINPDDANALGITKQLLGADAPADAPSMSSTLQKYVNKVEGDKVLPPDVQALPLNNAFKLNEIRKLIGSDMVKQSTDETDRIGLQQTYKQLTNALSDAGGDTFNGANKLAQQVILRNQVEDALSKLPASTQLNESGTVDVPLKTLYSRLFGTVDKQNDFLDKVSTAGGDPEATKGLIDIIGRLSNPSMSKLVTKEIGQDSVYLSNNEKGLIQGFLEKTMNGSYNQQLSNLLTDNKWVPVVRDLVAKENNPGLFASTLHSVLTGLSSPTTGTAAALGAGQAIVNPAIRTAGYMPNEPSQPSVPNSGGLLQQYGLVH